MSPSTTVFLCFDGLDTLAKAYLNGHPIGHFKNMYRQYRVDVRDKLAPSGETNMLLIVLSSPLRYVRRANQAEGYEGVSESHYLRKSHTDFGSYLGARPNSRRHSPSGITAINCRQSGSQGSHSTTAARYEELLSHPRLCRAPPISNLVLGHISTRLCIGAACKKRGCFLAGFRTRRTSEMGPPSSAERAVDFPSSAPEGAFSFSASFLAHLWGAVDIIMHTGSHGGLPDWLKPF